MVKALFLLLTACVLAACAQGRYGHDDASYRQCAELAREEGRVIKYIDTTLQYRRRHEPGPEVEAEYKEADAERRAIHRERRKLGCI